MITREPADATIGRYGRYTSVRLTVRATGEELRYQWQRLAPSGTEWATIKGATKASYTAKPSRWPDGTGFRVVVTGAGGTATSATAHLTVLLPTTTPAVDAEAAFGLTGLTQGVDLSSYQHTPAGRVSLPAVSAWTGPDGFVILRNGSGARPRKQEYPDACTGATRKIGKAPITRDCAYPALADAVTGTGLRLGHYWFNGWISTIDTTKKQVFAGGYTPAKSARQFVAWLLAEGNYTRASTDPLVLDIEPGYAWTKKVGDKTYRQKLRAWNAGEAVEFLTTVRDLLHRDGYQANLYVYLGANRTAETTPTGGYAWAGVADLARLWVASWGADDGRIPAAQPRVGAWWDEGWSIWQYSSNVRIAGSRVWGLDGDIAKADAFTPR